MSTYKWILIAALFIITKHWKHHKCPSPVEWIRKVPFVHLCNGIFVGNIKKRVTDNTQHKWISKAVWWQTLETRPQMLLLYDSTPEKAKDMNEKSDQWLARAESGGKDWKRARREYWTMLEMYIMMVVIFTWSSVCQNSPSRPHKKVIIISQCT